MYVYVQALTKVPMHKRVLSPHSHAHTHTGGELFLWPASLVLTDSLFRNPSLVHDRNVLELGSSHGLVAMAARAVGAHRVLATDKQDSSGFLSQNIAANSAHQVEVAALDWGIDMEAWGAQPPRGPGCTSEPRGPAGRTPWAGQPTAGRGAPRILAVADWDSRPSPPCYWGRARPAIAPAGGHCPRQQPRR